MVANRKWAFRTLDVETAFLQGVTFQELSEITGEPIREVSFVPPKGSERYFQEHDAQLDFTPRIKHVEASIWAEGCTALSEIEIRSGPEGHSGQTFAL